MEQTAREQTTPGAVADCPFCHPAANDIVDRNDRFYILADRFPVTTGHRLIIPWRHVENALDMDTAEIAAAWELARREASRLKVSDPAIAGFNLGFNCGLAAGQTIFHVHLHLIPRRTGDMDNPRGGVRGVIPARQHY
ncbi:MAG: HIT family protein [Deltaproteobacteria bacterium]|nr:HIT family protein [Candidatus Anaeroferrophillacea bacterium]